MKYHLAQIAQTTVALFATASLVPCAEAADRSVMSVPRDTHIYSRPAIRGDFRPLPAPTAPQPFVSNMLVVDAVVNNTNPALRNTDTIGGTEVSIGVDPNNTSRIVLTAFSGGWGASAPLWLSTRAGLTWTEEFTINPPPGVPGVTGPADQTVDFTHSKALAGTFLTGSGNVYSALSNNLTSSPGAFNYFTVGGVAQATNHLDGVNNEDQPWLLVGRSPAKKKGENVYVAYDDFNTAPDMRVAVAAATSPLNFTIDNRSGFSTGFVNPGHRLAVDPRSGAVYSLFQRRIAAGADGSQNINYMLNRSTDGGTTWTLNGSATGIVVANADSTQPWTKFCTVNALLGGVDHATVDPKTGDVVYVYGNRDPVTGNNRLAMRRLTPDGKGGLTIGPQIFITGQVQAAIPSVAITANRVIGVFYYTCDGTSTAGFPIITAHFSTSTDGGTTFFDNTLESFLSPAQDACLTQPPGLQPSCRAGTLPCRAVPGSPCDNASRQRVLGDYEQVKAVGNTFFGGFTGNRVGFYPLSPFSINDPIFFKVETKG